MLLLFGRRSMKNYTDFNQKVFRWLLFKLISSNGKMFISPWDFKSSNRKMFISPWDSSSLMANSQY